jgi:hypothetical protein
LRELRTGFGDSEAAMPAADLVIDTELDEPYAAAWQIANAFGLATKES